MNEDEEQEDRSWYPYEQGSSVGGSGWEGGVIIRDEEYGDPEDPEDADARVTLERIEADGFALTCSLYGFLAHTFRIGGEEAAAAAQTAFASAKPEMARLAALIPYEEDGAAEGARKAGALNAAIQAFTEQPPASGGTAA